jgi:hypothetical protein
VFLLWDRDADARPLPAFRSGSDLVRLVVEGWLSMDGHRFGRMGFRLQQEATETAGSTPGAEGVKELWFFADRRCWTPVVGNTPHQSGRSVLEEAVDQVATTLAAPRVPAPRPRRAGAAPAPVSGSTGAALSFRLAVSDDEGEPHYVRVVDNASGAVLAFTDSSPTPSAGEDAMAHLRAGDVAVDTLHDEGHDRWFFRFKSPAGDVLFRSMPMRTEREMTAAIDLMRSGASRAPVVDERPLAVGTVAPAPAS